jgi:hypothetical protein
MAWRLSTLTAAHGTMLDQRQSAELPWQHVSTLLHMSLWMWAAFHGCALAQASVAWREAAHGRLAAAFGSRHVQRVCKVVQQQSSQMLCAGVVQDRL